MNKNDELTKELAKNKADEYVIKKELEYSKKDFIEYLKSGKGDEIKKFDFVIENKPIKYHKPFKLKIKEFFQKISKVIGL